METTGDGGGAPDALEEREGATFRFLCPIYYSTAIQFSCIYRERVQRDLLWDQSILERENARVEFESGGERNGDAGDGVGDD
ncbi:unnamed protein product [Camellia sinensis]